MVDISFLLLSLTLLSMLISFYRSTSEIDHLLGKLLGSLSEDTIHLAIQDKNLLFTLAGQVGLSVSAVRDRLSYLQSN